MSYLDWDTSGTRLQRRRRYNLLDNVDSQASSSKPTVRSDGSALVAGDRWLDTSDRLWWFWDGTYWLSEKIYPAATSQLNATAAANTMILQPTSSYNLYFVDLRVGGLFNTPQNSSTYWSVVLQRVTSGTSGVATNITSAFIFNDIGISTGIWVGSKSADTNLHQDVSSLNAGYYRILASPTNSPGSISIAGLLRYRLAKI